MISEDNIKEINGYNKDLTYKIQNYIGLPPPSIRVRINLYDA